jgi:hypothetical protein
MPKLPWMKWFPDKWLSDERLRACGFAARGLWADIVSLTFKNDRRGYLQLNGKPLSPEQISRMTGAGSAEEVSRLLQELIDAGVPSVTQDGVLFCRHIVKAAEKSAKCSEAGKKGGNPSFKESEESTLKGQCKGSSKGDPKGTPKGSSILLLLNSPLLENAEFKSVFETFEQARKEKRSPLKETSAKMLLRKLEKYPVEIAIAAVKRATENGWTGVFPEQEAPNGAYKQGVRSQGVSATRVEAPAGKYEKLAARAQPAIPERVDEDSRTITASDGTSIPY